MSLSAILFILSVGALIVSFLQVVSKPEEDKRRWRIAIVLSAALLCINGVAAVGKRISDLRQEDTGKQRELEQRKMFADLMLDIKSLNSSANLSFERLNATIKSSSPATVADLRKEADALHTQLGAVTELVTRTSPNISIAEKLKSSVKEIHAGVIKLNSDIDAQQAKYAFDHSLSPAPFPPPDDGGMGHGIQKATNAGNSRQTDAGSQIAPPWPSINSASSLVGPALPVFVSLPTPDPWTDGLDPDPYSLLNAIRDGAVSAEFLATGASSGDSVEVRVSRPLHSGVPILKDYVVPPGSRLKSSNAAESNMTIRTIIGISVGENRYRPASAINVPNSGTTTYILDAFDTNFHKENPTPKNHFTLHTPEAVLSCLANAGKTLPAAAFQAAVWMFTDKLTFSEASAQFEVSNREWQEGEEIFGRCQNIDRDDKKVAPISMAR